MSTLRLALAGIVVLTAGGVLVAAAPIKVLSGTIRGVDRDAGKVTIAPTNAGADQTLRFGRETVIAVGTEAGDPGSLKADQKVTVFYDPTTRIISKLRVAVAASSAAKPQPEETKRTAMRPKLGDPPSPGAVALDGGNGAYALTVAKARSVEAVLTYEMTMPGITATEWVVVAPDPPELPGQTDVHGSFSPGGHRARDLSPLGRPLLAARVPGDRGDRAHKLSVRAEYGAVLLSRHLVRRVPGAEEASPAPLGAEERKRSLISGGLYDLDAPGFRQWVDDHHLTREPGEGQVDFARRVFLAIKRGFSYEYTGSMDRHASRVCAAGRSDCGGLAIVFVAALRAQSIPARILAGRWAQSAETGQEAGGSSYHQEHVKAEFYADGVGWVPADLASGVLHDRSPDGLRFFGHDDGDFLTLHIDPDLVLDTVHFGPSPMTCMNGGFCVWVVGRGKAHDPTTRQDWQVKSVASDR